jgi:uncharacterized repeat protein (TIGR01451 family)
MLKRFLLCGLVIMILVFSAIVFASAPPNASLTVNKTGVPLTQAAPGTIIWNITVTNTGDVTLTGVNVTDTRHGYLGAFGSLAPGDGGFFTIVENNLPTGTYTDQAYAAGYYGPESLTVIDFSDPVECVVAPIIESCDSSGAKTDTFNVGDDVYMNGTGFGNATTYSLYVVEDQVWSDGMAIPARVSGTATTVMSAPDGTIPPTLAWPNPLVPGKYDIVVDVNNNSQYDVGVDALDDNDITVTAGFFVIPEVPLGTIMTSLAMIVGLACYISIPKILKKSKP